MKNRVLILSVLMTLGACKTISYENAVSANRDRFYGDDEKTALLLDDYQDVSQVTADISRLADDQAYSKDLCDFAGMVIRDQRKFNTSLQLLALRKRIRIPNTESGERHKIYQQVRDVPDKKTFDRAYYENMKFLFNHIIDRSDSFLGNNSEGPVRDFIARNVSLYKDYIKKIGKMQEYMDKNPEPQVTKN